MVGKGRNEWRCYGLVILCLLRLDEKSPISNITHSREYENQKQSMFMVIFLHSIDGGNILHQQGAKPDIS